MLAALLAPLHFMLGWGFCVEVFDDINSMLLLTLLKSIPHDKDAA